MKGGESEEALRAMVGHFVEGCRRRDLKGNADKSKEMVLNVLGVRLACFKS